VKGLTRKVVSFAGALGAVGATAAMAAVCPAPCNACTQCINALMPMSAAVGAVGVGVVGSAVARTVGGRSLAAKGSADPDTAVHAPEASSGI
jgi:hypothetical protein